MNAPTIVGGLISKVFDGNKPMLKEIYLQSKQDRLEELETSEFNKAWEEATRPFYERCAALTFDTIARSAPELKERVAATLKDPGLAGYPDGTDFMYPSYIYMMAYYMYIGKKGSSFYGKQITKLCNQTTQSWLDEWEKEYRNNSDEQDEPEETEE